MKRYKYVAIQWELPCDKVQTPKQRRTSFTIMYRQADDKTGTRPFGGGDTALQRHRRVNKKRYYHRIQTNKCSEDGDKCEESSKLGGTVCTSCAH